MMFNNVALDVFIGLVFVYLIYSLLATVLQEAIANKFAFRAKVLEKAIIRMLEDGKSTTENHLKDRIESTIALFDRQNLLKDKLIAAWFYSHPLIKYLGEDNYYSKPAYLSAQNFSKVMIDLLKGMGNNSTNDVQTISNSIKEGTIYQLPIDLYSDHDNLAIQALRAQVAQLKFIAVDGESDKDPRALMAMERDLDPNGTAGLNKDTKMYIQSLWAESGANVDDFKSYLEQWYNDTMDRATGWYKRYIQLVLFVVGLIIAIVFNADTFTMYRILSKDKPARDQLVQMAIKSKDQLGAAVKGLSQADSLRYAAANEEVYNKTYESVAADAQSATSVLGGRPWFDSCTLCNTDTVFTHLDKAVAKDSTNSRLLTDSLKKSLSTKDSLNTVVNNLKKDSLKNKAQLITERAQLDLAISAFRVKKIRLDLVTKDLFTMRNQRARLYERCKYISDKKAAHWFVESPNQDGGIITILGWVLTALAISLGAPFWFDLLNKLMQLRGGSKIDSSGGKSTPAAGSTGVAQAQPQVNVHVNTQQPGGGAQG